MQYLLNAVIKGIIEGVTEFLPISSTAHLVLVRDLLPLTSDPDRQRQLDELFDIAVQFPAILAIVVLFRARLIASVRDLGSRPETRTFWLGIVLAFIPAALVGITFHKLIEKHLMHPVPIAIALIVGGLVLIAIERWGPEGDVAKAEDVPLSTAISIGVFQCLGMIPGTSRSSATILGGRVLGLSRKAAAEFSFFLALPTLGGACAYKLYKEASHIRWETDVPILIAGALAAFASAWIVVALFLKFLEKYSLAAFGWYRIVLGLVVLWLAR